MAKAAPPPGVRTTPPRMNAPLARAAKRGGERAAVDAFGDLALLARAGLILGPYEITGRMPWWLRRIERGGDMLALGPPDRPLQYIDCRDLAAWLLHAADTGICGTFNTVSKPGQATMSRPEWRAGWCPT
jgi:2'-hydroxyisoflavone reductase